MLRHRAQARSIRSRDQKREGGSRLLSTSVRPDIPQEAVDFAAQGLRLPGELAGRGEHLAGRVAGICGSLGDAGDVGGDFLRAGRGLLEVAGDLAGRGTLLFDRAGDRGRDLVDLADDLADALD